MKYVAAIIIPVVIFAIGFQIGVLYTGTTSPQDAVAPKSASKTFPTADSHSSHDAIPIPTATHHTTPAPVAEGQSVPSDAVSTTSSNQNEPHSENTVYFISPGFHDFGKVKEGMKRSFVFQIRRPENTPLRIGRIYSPCPCVSISSPKRIYGKHEPATLDVSVHSLSLEGKKDYTLTVEILEPKRITLSTRITIESQRVPARIRIHPDAFHLGSVSGQATAKIEFTNLTRQPIILQSPSSSLSGSTVTIQGNAMVAGGESRTMTLTLDAAIMPPGVINGMVTLRTNCPMHAEIQIPVDGMKR